MMRNWTIEEKNAVAEYIRNNPGGPGDAELARRLDRGLNAVQMQVWHQKHPDRKPGKRRVKNSHRGWSKVEDQFILDNDHKSARWIARKLKRSLGAVYDRKSRVKKWAKDLPHATPGIFPRLKPTAPIQMRIDGTDFPRQEKENQAEIAARGFKAVGDLSRTALAEAYLLGYEAAMAAKEGEILARIADKIRGLGAEQS